MEKGQTDTQAIFFLSTGRCATQFFADKLAKHFGDLARVEHEPFQKHYQPRHYFSTHNKGEPVRTCSKIKQHLASIEETLGERCYIETGWPAYGLLPHLIEHFAGRIKIVHLYRHPLRVAASLSTHQVYSHDRWAEKMSIAPTDHGVVQPHLAGDEWNEMDEFCRCLFWWTEINHFALRLRDEWEDLPWLSLRFEDVFSTGGSEALSELIDFLGFPQREAFLDSTTEKVDRYSKKTLEKIDITQIRRFDESMRIMSQLGYSLDEITEEEIHRRHVKPPLSRFIGRMCALTKPAPTPIRSE